jgi:hypothetical protein
MKKLVLAIGLGAFIVFGAGSGSLAAYRFENAAAVATAVISTGARLLSLNLALYPESNASASAVITASAAAHGTQERADMAQSYPASADTQRLICGGEICLVA